MFCRLKQSQIIDCADIGYYDKTDTKMESIDFNYEIPILKQFKIEDKKTTKSELLKNWPDNKIINYESLKIYYPKSYQHYDKLLSEAISLNRYHNYNTIKYPSEEMFPEFDSWYQMLYDKRKKLNELRTETSRLLIKLIDLDVFPLEYREGLILYTDDEEEIIQKPQIKLVINIKKINKLLSELVKTPIVIVENSIRQYLDDYYEIVLTFPTANFNGAYRKLILSDNILVILINSLLNN